MSYRAIIGTGVVGAVIAAICCFTPALVVLLGIIGLSAWVGWLDYVLLPALLIFSGLTAYGFYLRSKPQEAASVADTEQVR